MAAWISEAEFQAERAAFGSSAEPRQLERWRAEGLLPRPRQLPNYRGSRIEHPAGSARQVLAIERAYSVKKRREFVGATLWAAGFEVDERYWREGLIKADAQLRRISRIIQRLASTNEDTATLGEQAARLDHFSGVLAKVYQRLPTEQFARAINVGVEVVTGEFDRFDMPTDADEFSSEEVAYRAFDFEAGEGRHVLGKRFRFGAALEPVLAGIAETQIGNPLEGFSVSEIQAARDDVRNALKISVCLYEALAWIYGPQALGLRLAAFLGRTAPIHAIFQLAAGYARLRRRSNSFYSSDEIAEMARQAEATWLISEYFRELQNQHPELRKFVGPKRLKLAFTDSHEELNLLRDLERLEFPKPEFRPWDQWRKLSKRTMSPGLLAMSIGAPSKLDLADIVPAARGDAIR